MMKITSANDFAALVSSAAWKMGDKAIIAANLVDKRITLMGSDMDEAPMAYKDIHVVIARRVIWWRCWLNLNRGL